MTVMYDIGGAMTTGESLFSYGTSPLMDLTMNFCLFSLPANALMTQILYFNSRRYKGTFSYLVHLSGYFEIILLKQNDFGPPSRIS